MSRLPGPRAVNGADAGARLLVLITRFPEPGRTKTRLVPALGAEGACALQRAMAERTLKTQTPITVRLRELLPTKDDWRRSWPPITRGSIMGFLFGLVPGPTAMIATFSSYALERKLSKHPERFGKGAIEGVAGPEAANNGAAQGAFLPLLTLGIPFAPATAMLLTALLIHGGNGRRHVADSSGPHGERRGPAHRLPRDRTDGRRSGPPRRHRLAQGHSRRAWRSSRCLATRSPGSDERLGPGT